MSLDLLGLLLAPLLVLIPATAAAGMVAVGWLIFLACGGHTTQT